MAKTAPTSLTKAARKEVLGALRGEMASRGLDAYLIPSNDAHLNEYLPEENKRREWVSGFTGSVGDVLLGADHAWVFVDSRYYEQADSEVDSKIFTVSKLGLTGHPSLTEQIRTLAQEKKSLRLGFDPFTVSSAQLQSIKAGLKQTSIQFEALTINLVDRVWSQWKKKRPSAVLSEVFLLSEKAAGLAFPEKIRQLQHWMKENKIDSLPITKLDQIAWLFNLRGQDIPYNPVFKSYALLTQKKVMLFTDKKRLHPQAVALLEEFGQILPYEAYTDTLIQRISGKRVFIDPKHTAYGTEYLLQEAEAQVIQGKSPLELAKSQKNNSEQAGMKEANLRASRAKIRLLSWLDKQLKANKTLTENDVRLALEAFYAEDSAFFGLSFNTIAGTGPHSSIIHYGTPSTKKELEPGELFLLDSGSHYYDATKFMGTTDDTRTVIVGKANALQKNRYTLVLKAHIRCASQIFPQGADGIRLDGITRSPLWDYGIDYGHGTGHGVGAFLNVHEGPNGIHRMASQGLMPGMVTSIEPGFYEPGWGGIRIENLYLVGQAAPPSLVKEKEAHDTQWLGFEPLTLIPFDKRLIQKRLLSSEELEWLDHYHKLILKKLTPLLSAEETRWLKRMCNI